MLFDPGGSFTANNRHQGHGVNEEKVKFSFSVLSDLRESFGPEHPLWTLTIFHKLATTHTAMAVRGSGFPTRHALRSGHASTQVGKTCSNI